MDLRQLKHVVLIAKHGSLGRAAAAIGISEPAMSKSLSKLEADLGVRLFERGSKGITPTFYGDSVIKRAEAVLGELTTIRREVDELRGGERGLIRVGMRPSFGTAYLPQALAKVLRTRRDVRAVLREGFLPTLISELMQGQLDFVVATELEELDPSLVQEYFADSPVGVLARKDHPLASVPSPSSEAFTAAKWVMPLGFDPIRRYISDILTSNGIGPITVVMETNSVLSIKNFVIETDCLAFFPHHLYNAKSDPEITFLDAPNLFWNRRLNIVRRRLTNLSPAANQLVKELRGMKIAPLVRAGG